MTLLFFTYKKVRSKSTKSIWHKFIIYKISNKYRNEICTVDVYMKI